MTTPFPFTIGQVLTAAQMNAITELVVNDKTASHTLTAADAGDRVIMDSASATTITVNTSIFTAGQVIYVTNKGAGVCTITAGTATVSTTGTLALSQFASGVLYCISAGVFLFEGYDKAATSGVVQVKSTTKSDSFTMASTTFADITGLSVTITPTSASNKIFIIANVVASGNPSVANINLRFMRDSTAIGLGDAAGSRTRATAATTSPTDATSIANGVSFLDSPAATSATTYKVQIAANAASTIAVNRTINDSDLAGQTRSISTITVFEVTP